MDELIVLVPTRGRPQACFELADVFDDTCVGNTRLVFVVDSDDPMLELHHELAERDGVSLFVNNDVGTMNKALNSAAFYFRDRAQFLGFMGDDHRPRTEGWDGFLLETLRSTPGGIVYGNDLLQMHRLPTQVFLDARIVRTLGWMAPPELLHMYLDNFWKELGEELGTLRYHHGVIIEHMHPIAKKADWDDTYKTTNAAHVYEHDRQLFDLYVQERLAGDAWKISKVIS